MKQGSTGLAHPNQLIRAIGLWDFTALVVNITIGAGILGLPSRLYQLLGMNSLWAMIGTAVFIFILILCFAEVGSRFTHTGGAYLYAKSTYGPITGFLAGWLLWLSRLFSFASVCNLLVDYAAWLWPPAASGPVRISIIIVMVLLLGSLNFFGIKPATRVNNILTCLKLVVLICFVAVGLGHMPAQIHYTNISFRWSSFLSGILLLVFAFSGFDVAAIPAGEIKNPHRTVPKGLLLAIAIVTLLFIGIQWVCIATLPDLAKSAKPVADAASRFMGPAGALFVTIGALVTVAGTLNALMLTSTRLLFAMGEQQQMPAFLTVLHKRYHTPVWSIVITCLVILVLTVNSTFVSALTFSAVIRLFTFITTCLALPLLRRNKPDAPFKVKGGVILSVFAIVVSAVLFFNIDFKEAYGALIAAGFGLLIFGLYILYLKFRKQPVK